MDRRPSGGRPAASGDRRPSSSGDRRPSSSGDRRPTSAGRAERSGVPQAARASFVAEPPLDDEYTVAALDTEVRRDLRGLQKDTADSVARHLVAAGSLVDEDPQLALEHARYARRRASRIAVVREAAGIAAYHAGEWAEALAELRAARRMGGGPIHLPVMADIERALGRPERAVDIARGTEAAELGTAGRIELAIVGAGARRDLGELDAAVVGLQIPELDPSRREPWSVRLFYAYADNLLAAGRESDAVAWFVHAADADTDGETDAVGRIAELTGEDPDDADDFAFGVEDVAPETAGPVAGDGPEAEDVAAGEDLPDDPADEVGADADLPVDAADADAAVEDAADAEDVDELASDDAPMAANPADAGTSPGAGSDETASADARDEDDVVQDASDEVTQDEVTQDEVISDEVTPDEPTVVEEESDGDAADGEDSSDGAARDDSDPVGAAVDGAAVDEGGPVADPSTTAGEGTAR